MSMFKYASIAVLGLAIAACNAENKEMPEAQSADAATTAPTAAAVKVDPSDLAQVEAAIKAKLTPAGIKVESVKPAPIDGLFQVSMGSMRYLYTSADGEYVINGDIYQAQAGQMVNLTEQSRATERLAVVQNLKREQAITYSPAGEVKGRITVFTDTDCGYCRKLHNDIPALNKMGIEVSYLAFPRAGVGSGTYKRMASAWCAEDPETALTTLKTGGSIADNVCDANPIAQQYALGRQIGVSGTPALLLDNGEMLPGYLPPERLAKALKIN